MREQPFAFLLANGDALEIMIGDLAHEVAGIEVRRLQPALERADRHRRGRMGVDDRMRIGQFAVEQAVLDKARLVDVPWIVGVDLAAVRSEERRVGEECGSACRYRGWRW